VSDLAHAVDPELNLGDCIYIDDEPPESAHASATYDVPTAASDLAAGQGSRPITGILTFAPSQTDMLPCASFDLNALWSAPLPPPPPPQPKEGGEGGGVSGENEGGDAMDPGTPPDEEDRLGAGERGSVIGTEQGVEHEGEGRRGFAGCSSTKGRFTSRLERSCELLCPVEAPWTIC
jgi:hypothetical protein